MLLLLPLCYMPSDHPSEHLFSKLNILISPKLTTTLFVSVFSLGVKVCFDFWLFWYGFILSPRFKTNKQTTTTTTTKKTNKKQGFFFLFLCFSSTYNHRQEHSTLPAIASTSHVKNLISPQPSPLSSSNCSPESAAEVYSAQIPIHRRNCFWMLVYWQSWSWNMAFISISFIVSCYLM